MPGVATSPYPTVETVLNVARAAMADAGVDAISGEIVGDVFTDDRPGTLVTLQSAYDYVATELTNNGVETFAKTLVISNVPPVLTMDPGIDCVMGYSGYFDGVKNNQSAALPPDMRLPLWLQQRQSGTLNVFTPNPPQGACNDGLVGRTKTSYSYDWSWETDGIRTPGGLLTLDWKLRYIPFLPKLTLAGGGTQLLLILGCENAVGYTAAAMFSASTGGEAASALMGQADIFIAQMCTQTTRKQQRQNHRRKGYSAGRHSGWGTRR